MSLTHDAAAMMSHLAFRSWVLWLLLSLPCCDMAVVQAVTAAQAAEDASAQIADRLVGQSVDIELQSGRILHNVAIEKVTPGKTSGGVVRLQVLNSTTQRHSTLGATAVRKVTTPRGSALLVFDAASKSLLPPDAEPSEPSSGGVRLWPELTGQQQAAALEKQKKFIQAVSERFADLKLRLYETQYFLFLSDLPPAAVTIYTAYLDKMHEQLCRAFAFRDKDEVWLGRKLPVIAFSQSQPFAEFETEYFKHEVGSQKLQGVANLQGNGNVVIACHCGQDPYYFAGVIVHETTHGFLHRYKSGQLVPSWLNEGIADWVAMTVVRSDSGVRNKVKTGLERMRRLGTLGGDFFTADYIAPEQYGMAVAIVDYLLRRNPKGFREMIEGIKRGEKWQAALKKNYRVTPEELAYQFGMSVGIPNLKP